LNGVLVCFPDPLHLAPSFDSIIALPVIHIVETTMRTVLALMLAFTAAGLAAEPATAPSPIGLWLGTLKVGEAELRIAFSIHAGGTNEFVGTMTSLDQNRAEVPCRSVAFNDTTLELDLPTIRAKYTGKLDGKAARFLGEFTQAGKTFPLVLDRIEKLPEAKRPQQPKPPFPYTSEDVAFRNAAAGIDLAGTLTIPKGQGPFPAVVLVSGSGPQDRDETIFDHKPFLVLADHLVRAGIAVLRYDDRGVGKSGGRFAGATSADFATDAFAAVQSLRARKDIDPKGVGICGHSEGGLIGPMVAAEHPAEVAFLVLLAGPGIPGGQILKEQNLDAMRNAKVGDAYRKCMSDFFDEAMPLVASDRNAADLKRSLEELAGNLVKDWKDESERDTMRRHGAGLAAAFAEPWMRYFLAYDPAGALKKVQCPVFALNGEKDVQVRAEENLAAIAAALKAAGNDRVAVKEFPGLNHLFQTCKTGAATEYGSIEETISPVVLKEVAAWIASLRR
jgi:pimeloyl-ACP methyl ester carboxylesterase